LLEMEENERTSFSADNDLLNIEIKTFTDEEMEEADEEGEYQGYKIKVELEEGESSVGGNSAKAGKVFSCILCQFKSGWGDLKKHRVSKHGFKAYYYPCDKCSYVAKACSYLKEHVDSVHKGLKLSCDDCDAVYRNSSGLRKHINIHHRKVPYHCRLCDFQTLAVDGLKVHVDSEHKGVRYACDQCEFSGKSRSSLYSHVNFMHKGIRYYCDKCTYSSTQKGALNKHVKEIHLISGENVEEVIKEIKSYYCDQCSAVYQTSQGLGDHIKSVHEHIRYNCEQCDLSFTCPSNLLRHKKSLAKNPDLQKHYCRICEKRFCFELNLKKHIRREHSEENDKVPCDECEKIFYSKQNLMRHKKLHHSQPQQHIFSATPP